MAASLHTQRYGRRDPQPLVNAADIAVGGDASQTEKAPAFDRGWS
jgi:hypothetical protein